jgi:hypothetical protein
MSATRRHRDPIVIPPDTKGGFFLIMRDLLAKGVEEDSVETILPRIEAFYEEVAGRSA